MKQVNRNKVLNYSSFEEYECHFEKKDSYPYDFYLTIRAVWSLSQIKTLMDTPS